MTAVALHHDFRTTPEFVVAAHQASPAMDSVVGDRSLYVLLLQWVNWVVGDVMLSGGFLSVCGGVGCVVAATRLLGPWAGLWTLAQVGVLEAATVPGSTILVLMCILWAVCSSQTPRGWLTGTWLALAFGFEEWVWPMALVVVLFARSRLTVVVSFCGASWLLAHGNPVLPSIPSFDLLRDLSLMPAAWGNLTSGWIVWVGLLALVWGSVRRNRASRMLLAMSVVYVFGVTQIYGHVDKMFMAQVLIALGVAAVETGPALLVLALVLLGFRLPVVWDGTESHQGLQEVIRATATNPQQAMCTSSAFVRPADEPAWIRSCLTLKTIDQPPTEIYPRHLRQAAAQSGARLFAAEDTAILHTYPWLQALLSEPYPDGFDLIQEGQGWRVFRINP